ncbi:MAG: ATP-binding protein [Mariprofundus sp.]
MSTQAFLIPLLLLTLLWVVSAYSMRRKTACYQAEIRRLHDAAGNAGQLSEQHLNALLAAIDQIMLRLDSKGRVVAANASALAVFDITAEDLPQSMLTLYRDSDWQQLFKQALVHRPPQRPLPDMMVGERVLMPRIAHMGDNEILMLCLDITDKHRLELQRRSFMSNLMHDLKTPLTSLLGYARSLQRFGDDADFRQEATQVIAEEAKHVNHLLESMLTLDQIEFAGTDADAHCDAHDVIRQVCDILKEPVLAKNITLACDIAEGVSELRMDVDSFERIVRNLLENAVQYAPVGGEVMLSLQLEEQGMVRLVVQDDGQGIPEKHIKRVTERFYRVDKARSRAYGGHGLGLAIVKELSEAHSGHIILHNHQPHGLTVSVTIPAA